MIGAVELNGFSGLKILTFTHIWQGVSLRPLFAILIAFAMLLAPLAMKTDSAMAAMPTDHHAQMMEKGHCDGQPAGKNSKGAEKPCCAAMCAGIAVATSSSVEPAAFSRSIERPALKQSLDGFLAKLPTPPPRLA